MASTNDVALSNPDGVSANNDTTEVKLRCLELQNKISLVESETSLLSLAISRSTRTVKRLRTEYLVLLDLLELKLKRAENGDLDKEPVDPQLDLEELTQFLQLSILKLQSKQTLAQPGNGRRQTPVAAKRGPRKVKDPNFPKRPTNAYLLYCEGEKERIKTLPIEEQELIPDLSKHLTEGWKALDEEGRKPYYKIYELDKERFTRELEAYEKKKSKSESGDSSVLVKGEDAGNGDSALSATVGTNTATSTPEVEDDDFVHPLVKKIKLEESLSVTPVLVGSGLKSSGGVETEEDITGVEDNEDEEMEDEDIEEDEVDEDIADTTLLIPAETEDVDDEMDVEEDEDEGEDEISTVIPPSSDPIDPVKEDSTLPSDETPQ